MSGLLQGSLCQVNFCIGMHTVGKEAEMIDLHQNLRVLARLFALKVVCD